MYINLALVFAVRWGLRHEICEDHCRSTFLIKVRKVLMLIIECSVIRFTIFTTARSVSTATHVAVFADSAAEGATAFYYTHEAVAKAA